MNLLSSLRGRIFLASALLAVVSIGVAIYVVSVRATREAENALRREIVAAGAVVEQLTTMRADTFTMMTRLIADAPRLKAAVDTNDPPTVQNTAREYEGLLRSNLLLITNESGYVLATLGTSPQAALVAAGDLAVRHAMAGRESVHLVPQSDGVLQLITVPITIGLTNPEILGTLSVGFLLDDALAAQLKETTGSEVAFGMNGQLLATTLPRDDRAALGELLGRARRSQTVALASGQYAALPLPLLPPSGVEAADGEAVALILRSRTEQLSFLRAIHTELAFTAVVAVLLATLLSFAVARTITSPLAAITDVMREVSATGDLTRKIVLRGRRRWDDEDARLLATTFNTLIDSIARFQREMSQKERLSSLGRLSTVIAHEVRNPLMIIKAALHALRRPEVDTTALQEAVADIDQEVGRLNRIVNEVLDFARPIRFEMAPTDLNALCREATAAAQVRPGPIVALELDPSVPPVVTDAERLRQALVNLIVNARDAVEAQVEAVAVGVPANFGSASREIGDTTRDLAALSPARCVFLSTRAEPDHVTIVVSDRGLGIDRADLPRVFDPYFTTKRGGTGLGLPIAKNIIEGLGGTIIAASAPGRGTEMRIDLPSVARARSAPAHHGASTPRR